MARTESPNTSVVLQAIPDLSVVSKFQDYMVAATGVNSVYDVARSNIDAFVANSNMTEPQKANVLVELYGSMISSVTNACLSAAVQTEVEDRDGGYKLTKMYEETVTEEEKRDLLAAQNQKATADADNVESDTDYKVVMGWKAQADMAREDGVILNNLPAITESKLPSTAVGSSGTKYTQEAQIAASTYATYAKSYRESGVVGYSLSSGKLTSVTDSGSGNAKGLTAAQTDIAIRQEAGFDENMLQHVANSSASFMGLLLSGSQSGYATGTVTAGENTPLGMWADAIREMNSRALA